MFARFHKLIGVNGEPEQAASYPSYGRRAAGLGDVVRKRQKNKAQSGKEKTEKKPMLRIQTVVRRDHAANAKADHDTGKRGNSCNDGKLDAIEEFIDVNL